ncbi:MAG: isoprenylcysteine carboxylmethyltransferase family protein [Pirellulales bacterium]
MASSSSPAGGQIAVESQSARSLFDPILNFLVRRRILLSAILFVGLVAKDVAYGFKPLDWVNIRNPYGVLGVCLVAAGLALRSWAAGILHKNSRLTTVGPYSLIRNPLYAGSFLMMLGFCLLLNNLWDISLILVPVVVLYVVKVRQEETLLAKLFPSDWPGYSQRTPRFIPRLARTDVRADWRLSQWMRSREYQALGATLVALAALKLWQTYG